ncbi:MAG: hypothetical protein IKO55_08700 [Kiritimatiellae bacterium]|nr:hypothetical protein [Kiritimatiellia bacterium]
MVVGRRSVRPRAREGRRRHSAAFRSRSPLTPLAPRTDCRNLGIVLRYCALPIVTADMFRDAYRRKGLESRLLSRAIEDSSTVTSVLVPWNTCAMAQSTSLGISTIAYLPYCFFNIISPIMSVVVAAIISRGCHGQAHQVQPCQDMTAECEGSMVQMNRMSRE